MHAPLAHATAGCSRYQQCHPLHLVDFEKHNNIMKWLYYATKLTALCCPQSLIYCNIISVASTVVMILKKKKNCGYEEFFFKKRRKKKKKKNIFCFTWFRFIIFGLHIPSHEYLRPKIK